MITATADRPVDHARFDWYAATINTSVDTLRSVLRERLGASTVEPRDGAKNGYRNRELVLAEDGSTLATILHGGNGDIPHAFASSDATDAFVEVVRDLWPDRHKVSRMDVSLDYDDGDGTFDRLLALCHGIADGDRVDGDTRKRVAKVRTNQMGDWHHAYGGRTFYLGSFKSPVLVRLYEKGIQLRQDAHKRGRERFDLSDNFVRLEVQVRPDKGAKERAAQCTPVEAFGYSEWSRELLRRVEGAEVARVDIRERRASDHDRALNWMVKQYEKHIITEVGLVGGWERLGEALRLRMETASGDDGVWDADGGSVPF